MTAYCYILLSEKDSHFYIGSTNDLTRRLRQHVSGQVQSTRYRRPLKLWAYQVCDSIEDAAENEQKYKRSHDRIKRMIKSGMLILQT